MRRFFTIVVGLLSAGALLALFGPSLPEGNPLRVAAEWLRDFGTMIGSGFGGGYGPTPAG